LREEDVRWNNKASMRQVVGSNQSKVTPPKGDPFLKLNFVDSCLKCIASIQESLGLLLDTPIFNNQNFIFFLFDLFLIEIGRFPQASMFFPFWGGSFLLLMQWGSPLFMPIIY